MNAPRFLFYLILFFHSETNLRVPVVQKAILNIFPYPRGCRRPSEILRNSIPNHLDTNYFDSKELFQLEDILISGSYSEGMQKIDLKTFSFSDTDFMLILKNIKVTEEDQRKGNLAMKENSPFVTLYLQDEHLVEMWTDFTETSNNARGKTSTELSPLKLKERFRPNFWTNVCSTLQTRCRKS